MPCPVALRSPPSHALGFFFGKAAVDVPPRLGHFHVTIDDWKGTWAHTSDDPIMLVGLTPGTHKILLEVADPTHKILTSTIVSSTVPAKKPTGAPHSRWSRSKTLTVECSWLTAVISKKPNFPDTSDWIPLVDFSLARRTENGQKQSVMAKNNSKLFLALSVLLRF